MTQAARRVTRRSSPTLARRSHRPCQVAMPVPARPLEELVAGQLAKTFDDPIDLVAQAELDVPPNEFERVASSSRELAAKIRDGNRDTVRPLVKRVEVGPQTIVVRLASETIAEALGAVRDSHAACELTITINAQLRRTGKVVRFVDGNDAPFDGIEPQPHLIRLLQQARAWWNEMQNENLSATEMAVRYNTDLATISRAIRLNFLAPEIVERILAGTEPVHFNARFLKRIPALPICWEEQVRILSKPRWGASHIH